MAGRNDVPFYVKRPKVRLGCTRTCCAHALLFFLLLLLFQAGSPEKCLSYESLDEWKAFLRSPDSIQILSGALFSTHKIRPMNRSFQFLQTDVRMGWTLWESSPEPSFYRGHLDGLLTVSQAVIIKGFGSLISGIALQLRYTLLQTDSFWAPYIQGGVGAVYTDAYLEKSQNAIGQALEFTPQASLGIRFRVSENWSIDAEGMAYHMSNAYLSSRNESLNALGVFVGLTYSLHRKAERGNPMKAINPR